MPVSKKRKKFQRNDGVPSDLLGKMLDRLNVVEGAMLELTDLYEDRLAVELSEVQLKLMFIMRNIPIRRPVKSGLILAPNEKPQVELTTLEQVYLEQRDTFIERLREERAAAIQAYEQNLSAGGQSEAGDGDADDDTPDPSVTH